MNINYNELVYTKHFQKDIVENSFIIYINPHESIRRERPNARKDADSTERRINADRTDFENFNIFDLQVKNEDF